MPELALECPAKVNLFLKIVRRRPDGYHDLVTVMQPLALADGLTLSREGTGVALACSAPELPTDEGNLAVRAAQLFQAESGKKFGLRLGLVKRIPVAAGLGGGSSDAAGVLRGLNELCGRPLDEAALRRLGARLGADVPFFLVGGPALGTGIGDRLRPLTLPAYWYVLLNPGYAVDTGWVYRNLRQDFGGRSEEWLMAQVRQGLHGQVADLGWLANDLEEVTLGQHPDLREWQEALRQQGARAVLMSGSGPTIFGIYPDEGQARDAAAVLSRHPGLWVHVTQGRAGSGSQPERGKSGP